MISAAVIGAAGYTGIELVRLLLVHPGFDLVAVTSSAEAGRGVEDVYPALTGCGLTFQEPDVEAVAEISDVVFLAVPHTAAMPLVPTLLGSGCKVFDLSADFRLHSAELYEQTYETAHTAPDLLSQAVYGLPELHRSEIRDADLVACPGCYPTATLLAAAPAIEAGIAASDRVIVDAKSGVSGAGRTASATTHYCSVDESIAPYKVGTHRHTPEMTQELSAVAGHHVSVAFAPHLAPMDRGLLSTVWLDAADGVTAEDAYRAYADRFADEPFVTVHGSGRMPATSEVRGSNRAHIGVTVDEPAGLIIVACAIDNLVKGSGGQAVQCANIAYRYREADGLDLFGPVV